MNKSAAESSFSVSNADSKGSMNGAGRPACSMLGTKDDLAIVDYDIEPIWEIFSNDEYGSQNHLVREVYKQI